MYRSSSISRSVQCIIFFCVFFLVGCMGWEEAWKQEKGWKQFKQPTKKGNVSELLEKAKEQINHADTKEKLFEFIKTYESVLKIDPYNYKALSSLGRWLFAYGNAHVDNMEEKKRYFLASIKYNEQAMYTNPEFKDQVDKGADLWDACKVLTKREMAPMFYWYVSHGLYWAECLNPLEKLIGLVHAGRTVKVLDRMMEIDPTWAGGHPYCGWAIRYSLLPRLMGGDLEKAEEFFEKAIEAGPKWLPNRFSRAQHLHTKKKDREAFKKDLEWVVAQDPHNVDSPYPANVYYQKQAKKMLANIDDYF